MAEYIERDKVIKELEWYIERFPDCAECLEARKSIIAHIPAADVPSALWTDEPISGTEFMTHNQGQSGFEIHFRTDDKAKYEAVQDECRRQIGHAKHASDVRPVVLCRDCIHARHYTNKIKCGYWSEQTASEIVCEDDFCSYGEKREEC